MLKAVPHIRLSARSSGVRKGLPLAMSALMLTCLGGAAAALPQQAVAAERTWRLDEFTRVELTPIEPGTGDAARNEHPAHLAAAALRDTLALVKTSVRGETVPLFAPEELDELAPALAKAFDSAGPQDDLLVLSTARREGRFATPTALTARMFIRDGKLQLIVHDTRQDFMEAFRRAHIAPHFTYGSRTHASAVTLQSPGATAVRGDWLSLPMVSVAGPGAPAPGATPAGAVPATPAPAAATALPATPIAPPGPSTTDPEQRLQTLKRLHDRGLISDEEYRQKREEILRQL